MANNTMEKPGNKVYGHAVRTLKGRKCGDTVWACAFEFDVKKCGLSLLQEPTKGILVHSNTETANAADSQKSLNYGGLSINYFVPENAKGTGYAWSKAVNAYGRAYADTYEECSELYEKMIISWEDWFKSGVGFCKSYL